MIRSGFIVLHNAYRAKIVADKLWVETARAGPDKPLIFPSEDVLEEKQIVKSC